MNVDLSDAADAQQDAQRDPRESKVSYTDFEALKARMDAIE